jgi:hypothetical protein
MREGQWREDIIAIDIPENVFAEAQKIAAKKVDSFYNRCGYNKKDRIARIRDGYIGEWIFKKFIQDTLAEFAYSDLQMEEICPDYGHGYETDEKDDGWDIAFGKNKEITIDVKTYGMRNKTLEEAIPYMYNHMHLLVYEDQYEKNKNHADIYAQVFYIEQTRKGFIAGLLRGIPKHKRLFQQNSYYTRVCDLSPSMNLFTMEIPKLLANKYDATKWDTAEKSSSS